ncbi:MAG: hypothetical protein JWN94_1792 [Betaproteobacteria bacterium]|nr:hypothetical protein [Betaproteobacteria bacterium]
MYRIMAFVLVGMIVTVAGAQAQSTAPQTPLGGAWRVTQIAEPNKPPVTSPQPGLLIFAKQYYSFTRINGSKPLPDYPTNDKATDAEKVAVFDALYLNAGTYTATANTLTTKSIVAKSAFAMAGPGNNFDYSIAGDMLVLTQKPQGIVIRFVRVE